MIGFQSRGQEHRALSGIHRDVDRRPFRIGRHDNIHHSRRAAEVESIVRAARAALNPGRASREVPFRTRLAPIPTSI